MMTRRPKVHPPAFLIDKVVSGGQTGVDRAALDVAIDLGIPHGGWCPLGRIAEDGKIPSRYALSETDSAEYAVRTERNVVESDGTLILYRERLQRGTLLTNRLAKDHQKPLLRVRLDLDQDVQEVVDWIEANQIKTLNVAGPRASSYPEIYQQAVEFLQSLFAAKRGLPLFPDTETPKDLT